MMDHTNFKDICVTAARALHADASEQDGRCSLKIDGIDVLVDLDEEADALYCYVDLGDANSHDRMEVCEQLLALNLRTHVNHHGTYAFEPSSARAIFCANLPAATTLSADEFAEILRYYVDETQEARQLVGGFSQNTLGVVFTDARA
jgi:hypothetical protein